MLNLLNEWIVLRNMIASTFSIYPCPFISMDLERGISKIHGYPTNYAKIHMSLIKPKDTWERRKFIFLLQLSADVIMKELPTIRLINEIEILPCLAKLRAQLLPNNSLGINLNLTHRQQQSLPVFIIAKLNTIANIGVMVVAAVKENKSLSKRFWLENLSK